MKKKYLFIFMFINIFFITNVYGAQYQLGAFYGFQTTNVSSTTITKECTDFVGMCSVSKPISPNFSPICNTEKCYIRFAFTSSFRINAVDGKTWNVQNISTFAQIYSDNRYNPCELDNGKITCLVPNNKPISYIEFKFFSFDNYINYQDWEAYTAGLWFEPYEIEVFDLPANEQENFDELMNNDSTSYNSGIENIVGNTQLPNNSGLFDVLSSLSSFVGNLSASGSCSAISVPIPFTTQNLRLPCMTTEVYAPNFPEILVIWQLIVRGIVYYYIIVNLLKLLKDTIDPFSMKLEVLDL